MEKRDFIDISDIIAKESDFARRSYSGKTIKVLFCITILFSVAIAAEYHFDYIRKDTLLLSTLAILLYLIVFILFISERISDTTFQRDFKNALFAGAAGSSIAFFFIVKNTGKIVYYNPECKKYIGSLYLASLATEQESAFEKLMERFGLKDIQWKNADSQINSIDTTCKIYSPNGKCHNLSLDIRPICRPSGFFVVRACNNTAKNDRASLSDAMNLVFDTLPVGAYAAYATYKNGSIFYTNSRLTEILGYTSDEFVNGNLTPEDLLYTEEFPAYDGNGLWEGSILFKDKNNKPVNVFLRNIHVLEEGKDMRYGFISHSSDNSKPTTSEVLCTRENCLNEVWGYFLEDSPIAMVLLDSNGIVVRRNKMFRILSGDDNFKKGGRSILDLVNKPDRKKVLELFNDVKGGKSTGNKSIDITLSVRENTTTNAITVSLYINHINAEDSESMGFVVRLIDITEKTNLEERFVHSQKMQAVGQLAGGIAHDFNNLLTAMVGFCDLLLMRHPPGEQSFADIMQIKQNANRAANLVRQLLAFSRKQTLQPEVINITDTIAELSNLIRRLIGENIELKLHHGRDIWDVCVDEGQFEQVIINLAVNARDAMSGDGGMLTIKTFNVTIDDEHLIDPQMVSPTQDEDITDGCYVLIEVIDTGSGMSRDLMHKIFDPFFSTKEVGEGTGLGLSTVYGIIQQTGGHIYVSGTEGEGTKFSIFLNRHIQEEATEDSSENSDTMENDENQDLTGVGTVMLVEDEAPVLAFSSRALENKGYNVFKADCGEQALLIMEKHGDEIDVIVTDVVMPGITGPAMVKQITERYPNIRIIFVSGYGEDAFIKTYGSDREFNFLPKPFTLNQLASKVKSVIS